MRHLESQPALGGFNTSIRQKVQEHASFVAQFEMPRNFSGPFHSGCGPVGSAFIKADHTNLDHTTWNHQDVTEASLLLTRVFKKSPLELKILDSDSGVSA